MPCYRPLLGYRSRVRNADTGKRSIVWKASEGYLDFPVKLRCGQCIGCRLNHSCDWAVRAVHESQMHDENVFSTFTYRPESLPLHGMLVKSDFQDFMKRLRRRLGSDSVRVLYCGEYGDNFRRPHFHACLFGFRPSDLVHWKTVNGFRYFRSDFLDDVWGHGYTIHGEVTFESAAYVGRYVTKKVTGDRAIHHYSVVDDFGNVAISYPPEFAEPSRAPGLGRPWLEKYFSDVYPSDEVILKERRRRPPKYYDSWMQNFDPKLFEKVLRKRRISAVDFDADNRELSLYDFERNRLRDRVADLEFIHHSKANLLIRNYDGGLSA